MQVDIKQFAPTTPHSRRDKYIAQNRAWAAVIAFAALMLPGCGGGGATTSANTETASRAVTIRFQWPAASSATGRALPISTQSVAVRVRDANGFQDAQTINRPAGVGESYGTVQFLALSPGEATFQAQAYFGADATGAVLAEAAENRSLRRGQTENVTLTFVASYTVLTLQPSSTASLSILQGATLPLVARGLLTDGTVVTDQPAGLYNSSNTAVATVNASTGVVTGVGPGTATITFSDNFGRSASVVVTVRGADAEVIIK